MIPGIISASLLDILNEDELEQYCILLLEEQNLRKEYNKIKKSNNRLLESNTKSVEMYKNNEKIFQECMLAYEKELIRSQSISVNQKK